MSATLCSCIFKDARCGYKGRAKSCDKTLKRCNQLGNAVNFRGGVQPIPVSELDFIARPVAILPESAIEALRALATAVEKDNSILAEWVISQDPLSALEYRKRTVSVSIYI